MSGSPELSSPEQPSWAHRALQTLLDAPKSARLVALLSMIGIAPMAACDGEARTPVEEAPMAAASINPTSDDDLYWKCIALNTKKSAPPVDGRYSDESRAMGVQCLTDPKTAIGILETLDAVEDL